VTNTSNVSDVAWSPTGDWLAYVQNWSDETLEGQLSLIRPNGDDPHIVVRSGDAPDWSPDSVGTGAQLLIRDSHSPAWSRDGELIIFMRPEKCGRSICPEHVYLAFADGSNPHEVGPAYSDERRLAWLPDPYE
jgi:Tol biopolymer transport system component